MRIQYYSILLLSILASCSAETIYVPYIINDNEEENSDIVEEWYTDEFKQEMKAFGGIIHPNNVNPNDVTDETIAQIIRTSNESCIRLFGVAECFDRNSYDLVFVPRGKWDRFAAKFHGGIMPGGWCDHYFIALPYVEDISTWDIDVLNHERIHCSFNSRNEIASQYGTYLMALDEALRTNNITRVLEADRDLTEASGIYYYDLIYVFNYLHEYNVEHGSYPNMTEAFYAVTDVERGSSVNLYPEISEEALITEFFQYRADFYASMQDGLQHFCTPSGTDCVLDVLVITPEEVSLIVDVEEDPYPTYE